MAKTSMVQRELKRQRLVEPVNRRPLQGAPEVGKAATRLLGNQAAQPLSDHRASKSLLP
jgi:hypothetical protein